MARSKKAGTALVSMKELEALYATEAKASLETEPLDGRPVIRTRGKKFRIGEVVLKAPLHVVVLGSSLAFKYFDSEFDPEDPTSPACAAVGYVGKELEMRPFDSSPVKQHETCQGCPQNAFGTADKGKGKACRNARLVALIALNDERPEPQILVMEIPPTGLRKFSAYVKQVASVADRPLHGVITSFDFDEEQDWPVPVASFVKPIDQVDLAQKAIKARERAIKEVLYAPVDFSGYRSPAEIAKARKGGKAKPAAAAPSKKAARKF